jgi:hypothetical protein
MTLPAIYSYHLICEVCILLVKNRFLIKGALLLSRDLSHNLFIDKV